MKHWIAGLLMLIALAGCAAPTREPAPPAQADARFGVIVMAHGGGATWNREVGAALAPLRDEFPMEIAFGMADAASLQAAADRLRAGGVDRIGVVRLFVSGESWYARTRQILGLDPGAPARPAEDAHAEHAGHSMAFWRLQADARFAMSRDGLMDATEMSDVLRARARALSREPAKEDVLVLAHGPEDDAENARWLARIEARAAPLREAGFRRVHVETLREDWPEKRAEAEARIRAFVERARAEGGQAIVIPFRVQGFGPYRKVLEGLDYRADGHGLVPDPRVTDWVRAQAERLRAELAAGR